MSRSGTRDGSNDDPTLLQQFHAVIKKWEEGRTDTAHYDPTETMREMANILEKANDFYLMKDPDPFEERHPSRIDPECPFGMILKSFFKKDNLVSDIFSSYMKDNYFTQKGLSKSSFELNVASCRVLLGILPGLEIQVLADTDGLIKKLFDWALKSEEPLQSYATGLLAVAMEIQDIATEYEFRAINDQLIPEMIKRMKLYKAERKKQGPNQENSFKRPFSMFSSKNNSTVAGLTSPSKSPSRRVSTDMEEGIKTSGWASIPSPNMPNGSDWSNSSWAEMESQLIGHFPIYPLTTSAKQVFVLRYLQPLGEYQEFLQHIVDENIHELLGDLINLRENRDARLSFEALRFLCGMFCHKKICMEWVQNNGIELLVDVPKPSIAATAVSQCLYYLACDDSSMEKICHLPQPILQKMVKYMLWNMECSHESGKQWAINFFGLASNFRILLNIIDEQDGIRKLFNSVSVLPILATEEQEILSDDEEYAQRQCIRCVTVALKRYFEAHLAIKADQLQRCQDEFQGNPGLSHYKAMRSSAMQVANNIETVFNLMPFKSRWSPVENFIQLGGVIKCFQIIAIAYDWTFQGRSEMMRAALDVLSICSISPRAQLQFCERIEIPDNAKQVAFNLLLGACEGEFVHDSPDVQRASLNVIINCVCAPIHRPTSLNRINTGMSSAKKKSTGKTSEDLINKIWDCVRSNNGIMTLLQLLHIKTPLTDADSIRALACKALVGLARSPAARQIMSKLGIFTNGELQSLVREPVLQDKRAEHVKFQEYALDLIKKVSGPEGSTQVGTSDFSLEMLHRQSVVAQTKITFPKKQLLQLIQGYLSSQGLHESAAVLNKEASLALMTSKTLTHKMTTPITVAATSGSLATPSTPAKTTPFRSSQTKNQSPREVRNHTLINPATPTTSKEPLHLRIKRKNEAALLNSPHHSSSPVPGGAPKSLQKAYEVKNFSEFTEVPNEESQKIDLVTIVCDYLSAQHSLCKNPMVTCPEFDLLAHHKCPDPRPKQSAPWNFTTRVMQRQIFSPFGGPEGRNLDRKLLYSRFRPVKTFRCADEQDTIENAFCSCAIMPPDNTFLLAGTYLGEVKMFNLKNGSEESTYHCHDSQVINVQPNNDGTLVLTSSPWRAPYSILWSLGEFFDKKLVFKDDDYAEFSKLNQDKVITTQNELATIYDISTGQKIRELKPVISNEYAKNRATFDPSDELVLNDGVLFDMRMSREIRKLDKLNPNLNGVFHPNGLEIVSNTEVWDIRNFHLLRTVPGLDQCQVTFSNNGDIIYGVTLEIETDDGEKYDSAFKTFDSHDYSSIATIETRRGVVDISSSLNDLQVAVVENSLSPQIKEESVVRLYDVGRLRADEEDYEDMDEDENAEGDEDEPGHLGLGDDDDDDEELFDIDSGSSDEDIQFIGEDELDDSNEDENEEDSNDSSEADDEDADEDDAEQEGDEAEEDDDDEEEVVEGDQVMASEDDDQWEDLSDVEQA